MQAVIAPESKGSVQFSDVSSDETQYDYYKPEVQDPIDMTRNPDRTSSGVAPIVKNKNVQKILLAAIVIWVIYSSTRYGG
jgi:hypothetical protein